MLGGAPARAYVAAYYGSAVAVIDTDANLLLNTIPVFGFPAALGIHPKTAYVYAISNDQAEYPTSGTLFLIDTESAAVSALVSLPGPVNDMALARDGARAYVTDAQAPRVVVFETATWTPISEISVGDRYPADAIAVDADGRYVYVAAWVHVTGGSWYQATLVIDTATDSIVDTLPLAHITALVVVDVP